MRCKEAEGAAVSLSQECGSFNTTFYWPIS